MAYRRTLFLTLIGFLLISSLAHAGEFSGFSKDITLLANNVLEMELQGKPESFITIQIRKAELNPTAVNEKGDLTGINYKDSIYITWGQKEGVSEYVIYKAYSKDGPWMEWTRVIVVPDRRTSAMEGTTEAQTIDLCYKVEALDSKGKTIKKYEPVCVPKWQEEESSLPIVQKTISDNKSSFAFSGSEEI